MNEAKRNECMLDHLVVRLSDSVTIIHGDCRDVLPVECDAVISDPPYGIAHKSGGGTGGKWHFVRHQGVTIAGDAEPFDPETVLALGKPWVLWGANFYSDRLPGCGWLVWDKRNGIEGMEFNRSDSELAGMSGSKTVKTFRHMWHGLCRATEVGEHLHPTQKPVALMQWCMEQANVAEGATVLDPYMGSGTTGIACIRTGRRFVGIEIDAGHFETARKRLEKELRQGRLPLEFDTHNAEADVSRASRDNVRPLVGTPNQKGG